ncbi:unnamed protein product [Adineta ricciae]|uniref:G-protein coupled receptors family 1 profile domain-containing protein n=1 Tax=Adineta ricciae TaxID=249248 RepID=A0A814JGF2_ADIRI|nr:unnamed protein product [Adineta ricciae]CAF1390305.1 unnamed protein product [Adineta ricciae]
MDSNMTLCVGTLFHEIKPTECLLGRICALVIVLVSIFAIFFNFRFLHWSSYHRNVRSRHYSLIISMIISSISVLVVISPSIFFQCFYCYRWCSEFYCLFEGFVNYLNGCVNMFMLMMISLIRYSSVIHTNIRQRYFEQHSCLTVITCWFCGLLFAVPPLFHWNEYVPEGVGFHCGLNWFDRSTKSRVYFVLTFAFVYFIPLLILLVVNIYVYCVIRRLIRGETRVSQSNARLTDHPRRSTTNTTTSTRSSSTITEKSDRIRSMNSLSGHPRLIPRRTLDIIQSYHRLSRLNRLRADRRFALATTFLISEYVLSWTPYAIIALIYLFDIDLISQHSITMTICAFIAKISMILNPFIYIATTKKSQLATILLCKVCSCSYCRLKKNIIAL